MKIAFDVDVLAKQMDINTMVHQVADWGYKYIEQAILITKKEKSLNDNIVCNSEKLKELINLLYSNSSNVDKEKHKNIEDNGGAELEE